MKEIKMYLAHSKGDYGNDYIVDITKITVDKFKKFGIKCNILDPSKIQVKESEKTSEEYFKVMLKYFYPMINESDIVLAIADSKTDTLSSGVMTEVKYAKSINKEIIKV